MSLPVMPSTHTWVQGGPVLEKAGRNTLYASDSEVAWVWDEDTGIQVTDLRDANGNTISVVPIVNGWVAGVGVPNAVVLPSLSVGMNGPHYPALPVSTLRTAASALAPSDTIIASRVTTPGSATDNALKGRYAIAATVTTAGTLGTGKHTPVDATSGALTMTLPGSPSAGEHLSVEKVDATANAVTVSGSLRGATSTITLVLQHETLELLADGSGSWWPVAGHKTKGSLDGLYAARWQPNTAYLAGQAVVNPSGDLVTAKVNFTSGSSYSSANWNLSAAYESGSATVLFVDPVNGSDSLFQGKTWIAAKKTLSAAIAALPSAGGKVELGAGIIDETATIDITKPVIIAGKGCGIGAGAVTTVRFPAGVPGIIVEAGGQTSKLTGFRVTSLSTAAGTDDGILVRGHGTVLDELHVEFFGRDGLSFDTTISGNANSCRIGRVRSLQNQRHGLYMNGVDANLLTALNLEVVLNGGWGVFINSGSVYGAVFLSPNIDRNTLGGVSDAGTGTRWISPDVEPGPPGYNVTLTGNGIVWDADTRTNPTITYGVNQRVTWGGTPLQRLRILDATATKQMSWTMGIYEATSLALTDDTNAVNVLDYRPLTQRFEHLTPLVTKALYQTLVSVAYAATLTFDVRTGNVFDVALTGNVTSSSFATTNVAGSPIITLCWTQDATGGRTYAWPSNCRFAANTAPSDTTASTSTSVTFRYNIVTNKFLEIGRAVAVPI